MTVSVHLLSICLCTFFSMKTRIKEWHGPVLYYFFLRYVFILLTIFVLFPSFSHVILFFLRFQFPVCFSFQAWNGWACYNCGIWIVSLLNTYAPNNGWKEEENSFQRRRKWDKKMLEFVQCVNKPLIWCGDLNVR